MVDALNRDMPYDEFVRWQLAGDEVAPDDASAFIATGFNRCYPDMVDLNDQKLRRQNALNDITETTGLVFLGLTIGCARCHDHKFDPIRIDDFYRLQAFFTPARFRDDYPIASASERAAYEEKAAPLGSARSTALAGRPCSAWSSPSATAIAPGLPPKVNDETAAAFNRPEAERTPDGRPPDLRRAGQGPADRPRGLDASSSTRPRRDFARAWLARLATLEEVGPARPPPRARDRRDEPEAPPTYLLRRGDAHRPGARGRARRSRRSSAATTRPRSPGRRPRRTSSGRRRALADWLVRPDHPLTARVIVNRLWQHHFGRGIVATPSDFGTMGAEPTHPELLDWLATELVARGWSLKAMHRLMVTSATYRQSSRPTRPPRPPTPRTRSSGGTTGSGSTARRSATPCSPSRASSTSRWAAPASSPSSPPSSPS